MPPYLSRRRATISVSAPSPPRSDRGHIAGLQRHRRRGAQITSVRRHRQIGHCRTRLNRIVCTGGCYGVGAWLHCRWHPIRSPSRDRRYRMYRASAFDNIVQARSRNAE
jgi:hypothetical protein